ncbi:NHLP family bacteriocin export ABC transporter peptidase/permease/ATPase, partial [bacterium]|nr:NHLP family bacteriocin export ABC transporter peptidase/permease/ATPase [bacterium]
MSGEEKLQHFKARVSQWLRPNRAKVPGVLQMEAVECGAASLAMLLGYYGRMLPLEQLRLDCNVTRDGTNAANLARAARKHGLKAKGFRKEPAQLAQLPMPAIIHWNFNHFLVLEGIVGDKVYLNDPAGGRRTVTKTDLDRSFTGVVLVMEKADDFEPVRAKPTLAEQMRQRLAKSRIDLLFILLVTLGLVLPALVIPAFTKIFIDQYLVNQLSDWVPMLLLAMAGMLCLSALLTWLQQRALLRLETRLALSSSSRFLWHVLQLPLAFFSQRHPGEIASRVTVNDRVARLLSGEFANLALSMLTMLFFFALMLAYDWVLASLSAAIALVNVVMLRLFNALRADA